MPDQITVQNREELLYLLAEACELEHGLCCSYLFAAFSLKSSLREGLTAEELAAVTRWKQSILGIATQEMLHLSLANNLLTALGAGPHFHRPNFPVQSRYYPPEIQLALQPLSMETITHFVYVERPETTPVADAPTYQTDAEALESNTASDTAIVPTAQVYATVNELYRGIQQGFASLVDRYGADNLFLGPPRAQITTRYFQFDGLVPVTDLASATAAITHIIDEGEGGSGNQEDSHYGKFVRIRDEYEALIRQNAGFVPARPVLANPFTHVPPDASTVGVIDDPYTVQVSDLCNGAYETLIQLLSRFFLHTDETDTELSRLIETALVIMSKVLQPLGELLTMLPAGPSHPGCTAGPGFEFYRAVYTLPHKRAAWMLMQERLRELAAFALKLVPQGADSLILREVSACLDEQADALGRPG